MYNLPYFKEQDNEVVLGFMRKHPFGFLTGCANGKPLCTQVPFFIDEIDGKLFLSGHMMKQTDHHKAFLQNENVLAVFTGPHTYVSASWYTDQQTASTWNYMSVHAKGVIRFLEQSALLKVLQRTTAHFENDPDSPSLFEKLPVDYVQRLTKAIIAFEIEVFEIDNVFKLSQNRDEKSYYNIIDKLKQQDEDGRKIAEEMEKRASQLFKKHDDPQSEILRP